MWQVPVVHVRRVHDVVMYLAKSSHLSTCVARSPLSLISSRLPPPGAASFIRLQVTGWLSHVPWMNNLHSIYWSEECSTSTLLDTFAVAWHVLSSDPSDICSVFHPHSYKGKLSISSFFMVCCLRYLIWVWAGPCFEIRNPTPIASFIILVTLFTLLSWRDMATHAAWRPREREIGPFNLFVSM